MHASVYVMRARGSLVTGKCGCTVCSIAAAVNCRSCTSVSRYSCTGNYGCTVCSMTRHGVARILARVGRSNSVALRKGGREGQKGARAPAPQGPYCCGPRTKVGPDGASYEPLPFRQPQMMHPRRSLPSQQLAVTHAQYSNCPLNLWSHLVSRGCERSDTLIRYRQRTLSKASGPPAGWRCGAVNTLVCLCAHCCCSHADSAAAKPKWLS